MKDFKTFVDVIYTMPSRALLEDFLLGITTPGERRELTQRIAIVKRLIKGVPHSKIAADLGVGVATVTRGSKELAAKHFKIFTTGGTQAWR